MINTLSHSACGMAGFFRRIGIRYVALLDTRPYVTKSVTSGAIMWLGDAIQQGIEHKGKLDRYVEQLKKDAETGNYDKDTVMRKRRKPSYIGDYDVIRSARMGAIGLVVMGPVFHNWFNFLERLAPGATPRAVFTKVLVDQTVMAPTFIAFFFSTIGLLSGDTYEQIKESVTSNYWPSLQTNYTIWPAAQVINFYFVPPNLRVFSMNWVGCGFNTYLSYRVNMNKFNQEQDK